MVSRPWDSTQDFLKEHVPLPVLLTHQSLPPFILLDVFYWEGETLILGTTAKERIVLFTESEFRAAPWSHVVWAQDGMPRAREIAVGRAKVRTGAVKLRVSWEGGEEFVEIPYYYFPVP